MAIKSINPYLSFNGTAAQAIALYESALDAKVSVRMRFADAAGMGQPTTPENADRVMHATLHIGGGVIMISDSMPGTPVSKESNVQVSLDFGDAEDMAKKFDALAVGGNVTMPLQDTFWGARFGMLTDAYDIHWMFNHDLKKG